MQQWPVSEEPGIAQGSLANPMPSSPGAPPQAFVFRHGPAREAPVQIAQRRVECRFIVPTVVRDPTPDDGIEHPRQIVNPSVNATAKLPVANGLSDRLGRHIADARTEVDEVLTPPILRPPGTKGVPEIVKLFVGIVPASIIILTVDDFRLRRMKLQSALGKASLERFLQP